MITIEVNNRKIDFTEVWYHAQAKPNPGGHSYALRIDLNEKEIIQVFEKMLSTRINDKRFCFAGVATSNDSSFNLVRWTMEYLDSVYKAKPEDYSVNWVFNNIETVQVNDKTLIIRGSASPALK